MSKLADKVFVKSLQTSLQTKRASEMPLCVDEFKVQDSFSSFRMVEETLYEIKVSIGNRIWIRDIDSSEELNRAVHITKKGIIEEVFGEFRVLLMKCYKEVYNGDREKSLDAIRELEKQMFEVSDE